MSAAAPILEARGLDKSYPGVHAVAGVDFHVNAGEVVGLVGKNGAGKSTLIKIFTGAVSPDAGEILIDGEEVSLAGPAAARNHGLAFLHQELNLVPDLSIAENLGLGGGYPKTGPFMSWRRLRRRARDVLAQVNLADLDPRTPAAALSPVEQREVMIAAALWHSARVFILDEPTASLTDHEIERLHRIVRRMKEEGTGIVYVSHRLEEIIELSDRVVVMRDGEVVAEVQRSEVDRRGLVDLISGGEPVAASARRRRGSADGASIALRAEGIVRKGVAVGPPIIVREGEIVGLAGLAGSGRSSLARAIYGADPPEEGSIWVNEEPLERHSPAASLDRGLILLTEDRRHQGLINDFDVARNITISVLPRFRRAAGLPSPSRGKERQLVDDFIERLAIKTPSGSTPIAALSGGNQQKVLMARWLAAEGSVFILDEPTIGVDVEAKEEIYSLVGELADAGAGILLICSDFEELADSCQRIYVLREGAVVGELSSGEVTQGQIVELCYEAPQGVATT